MNFQAKNITSSALNKFVNMTNSRIFNNTNVALCEIKYAFHGKI